MCKFTYDELKDACDTCTTITEIARKFESNRSTIREYLIKYNLYDSFKNK